MLPSEISVDVHDSRSGADDQPFPMLFADEFLVGAHFRIGIMLMAKAKIGTSEPPWL